MSLLPLVTPNQEQAWPAEWQSLQEGEVLLVAESLGQAGVVRWRQAGFSFTAPCLLPPLRSDARLRFLLRAVSPARLDPVEASPEAQRDSLRALEQRLSNAGETPPALCLEESLLQHYNAVEAARANTLTRLEVLDQRTSQRLSIAVEAAAQEQANPARSLSRGNDPLRSAIDWLVESLEREPSTAVVASGPARERVHRLLAAAPVRSREVVIDREALSADSGPLVAFHSDDPERIACLRPSPQGYWIWEPFTEPQPRKLRLNDGSLQDFSPRMLSLLPRLQSRDLAIRGLIAFAYGRSGGAAGLIGAGLVVGLVVGFLLAIGREVGATRWVFGLGGLGGLLGVCTAVVSPGFRLPILVTVLSMGLGLLTPTFNTILTNQALPDRDLALTLQMGAILLAGGLAGIGLEWTRSSQLLRIELQGLTRLEFGTLDRLLQLPASFFGAESIGALMLRFQAVRSLSDGIRSLLSGGLLQSLMTAVYLLFMLRISVKLTALALVLALLLLVPTALLAVEARRLERQSEEAKGLAFGRSLELISSVSKLRLAGAEAAAMSWWAQEYRRSIVYHQAQKAKANISTLLQAITPHLGTLLIFITITKLAAEASAAPPGSPSAPNIGELLGFLSAFGTFIGSMASIAGLADKAVDLPVYLERARPILNTPPEVFPQARDPGQLSGRLEVDRVSYRYSPELPLALDRVSLRMEPGEFVALVGPSGSGKSSLIRLLLGFASPEEGVIRYDDQNLSGLLITAVRRQIGTVMQNSGIFSGSIFETIAGSAIISLEQAWEAVELVGLADDIRAMPMGMQTVVPEGGGTFSGGQRQRLAIARALVRKPKILIFDEATSALDNRTQAIVTQSLEALAVSRLVVAHRLSTIVHADRIVTFDNGCVVQCGTFDDLLADRQGMFAALMRRQVT